MASTHATATRRTHVQLAALLVGAAFLLVGVLGFVPGITSNVGELTFAGHHSGAMLLGLFQVSILHNIVHLLFGITGLMFARGRLSAKRYLVIGGIIYLVLWIYGLLVGHETPANFVPLNDADNWLHLVLGAAMVALGSILGRQKA